MVLVLAHYLPVKAYATKVPAQQSPWSQYGWKSGFPSGSLLSCRTFKTKASILDLLSVLSLSIFCNPYFLLSLSILNRNYLLFFLTRIPNSHSTKKKKSLETKCRCFRISYTNNFLLGRRIFPKSKSGFIFSREY